MTFASQPRTQRTDRATPASASAPAEPPVRVLVALPQSGRTTWLLERSLALAGTVGPRPLWVPGDSTVDHPAHVEALPLDALLAIDPASLGTRVIALDDLHLHPEPVVEPLAEHLDAAMEHGAVVLATSLVVPGGRWATWAEERRVRWFGQDDLQVDERSYTAALVPLGLFARNARRLHRDLDGWAGPLAAAADRPTSPRRVDEHRLSLAALDRAARDLAPFVEALSPLPSGISLLPAICSPMATAAFDGGAAALALAAIARFVPPVEGADVPVRPHPILRRILASAAPPGPDADDIRARALACYLAQDRIADAVRLLIEAHRPDEALELIREQQLIILLYDGPGMQRRLMEELPRASWTAGDNLMFAVACLADGDHRQAAFALSTSVMLAPDLPADIALAREVCTAYLGMLSHPPEICLEAGQRALKTLDGIPTDTPLPHLLIARDHREYRCLTLNHIARNQILLGDWDGALRSLDQAGRCGHPLLDHAEGMFRAWVHGLRGDAAEAQRLATRSLDAADFWPEVHVLAVEARLALVEVHLLQGRIEAALQVADDAVQGALARRSDHHLACALVAVAEAELRSGRTLHARAALDRIGDGAYGFVGQRADAIRARTLLADGEVYDARTVLRNLPLNQHTVLALAEAVAAGVDAPWSAEQILAWEPPPWRSALQAFGDARAVLTPTPGIGVGGSIGGPAPADPHRLAAVDRVAKAHDLSERETEIVLGLLAGKTLADVADGLYISRNTLKTHLRSVYRKLDVHTRDEAVQVVVRAEMDRQ
jgi:DNA-binding CsgD family transcriptional regulator/tetratricopeptide (TPR) repeat protein